MTSKISHSEPESRRPTTSTSRELRLWLPNHKLPSLNKLFAMNHWVRQKFRDQLKLALTRAFISSPDPGKTQTMPARNIISIGYDPRDFCQTIQTMILNSPSGKSKSKKKKTKAS